MQVQPAKIPGLDIQPSPTQSSNKSSRRRKGDEMEANGISKHRGSDAARNETAGTNTNGAGIKSTATATAPSPKRQKTLGTTAPKPLMNRTNTLGSSIKILPFTGVFPAKIKCSRGPLSSSQQHQQAQVSDRGDSQQSENCENQAPAPTPPFRVSSACSQPFQLPQLVSRLSTATERSIVTGSAGTGMRIVPSNSASIHMKRITSVYIKEQKEEKARELKEGKLETPSNKEERDAVDEDGDGDADAEETQQMPGSTLEPHLSSTKKSTRQRFRIRTRNPKAFILPGSTLATRLENLMQESVGSFSGQGSRQDRNDSQQVPEMSEAEKQAMFSIVRQPPVSASQLAMSQDSHGIPCSLTGAALNSQPGNQRVIPVPLSQVLDDPLPTLSQGSGGIHVLLKASQEADEYEESLNYSNSRKSSLSTGIESPSLLASEKETKKKKTKN